MTIDEVLNFDCKGISLHDYEALINKRDKARKRIGRISEQIFEEADAIEVLVDDYDADHQILFRKHHTRMQNLRAKLHKAQEEYNELEMEILSHQNR